MCDLHVNKAIKSVGLVEWKKKEKQNDVLFLALLKKICALTTLLMSCFAAI